MSVSERMLRESVSDPRGPSLYTSPLNPSRILASGKPFHSSTALSAEPRILCEGGYPSQLPQQKWHPIRIERQSPYPGPSPAGPGRIKLRLLLRVLVFEEPRRQPRRAVGSLDRRRGSLGLRSWSGARGLNLTGQEIGECRGEIQGPFSEDLMELWTPLDSLSSRRRWICWI
ncbi:uncharacterized protein BJX67DRAFT_352602 [Aspergillus lucknowensis]|uniref:Uncharacterized protein n=1 Tax=Aspergillus lucknowensis TaxID=176173 RepID=A0ABR4LVZ1_9EURO